MDERRPDALTDAALERQLEAALQVEPSPEFVSRVRTHIASDRQPGHVRSGWRYALVPLGGIAVAAMVLLLWPHPSPAIREPMSTSVPPAIAATPRLADPPAASPPGPIGPDRPAIRASEPKSTVRAGRRPQIAAGRAAAAVAVTLDRSEVAAFHRLAERIAAGQLPLAAAAAGDGQITIEPIAIEPIVLMVRLEEGERP